MDYSTGNFTQTTKNNTHGWLVGLMAAEDIAKTNKVEIKFWNYEDDPGNYGTKTFEGESEMIFVISGKLMIRIGEDDDLAEQVVFPNHHIIIRGGVKKRISLITKSCSGITVRWPAQPKK